MFYFFVLFIIAGGVVFLGFKCLVARRQFVCVRERETRQESRGSVCVMKAENTHSHIHRVSAKTHAHTHKETNRLLLFWTYFLALSIV